MTALAAAILAVSAANAQTATSPKFEYRRVITGLTTKATPAAPTPTPSPAPAPASAPAPLTYSAELSTTELKFDPIDVGTSAKKSVLLMNTGTGSLTVSPPSTTGASFSAATQCGSTLAVGAQCATEVTFSPVSGGPQTGELSVPLSTTTGSPFKVTLSGEGLFSAGTLTGASNDFGKVSVGQSKSLLLTYQNTGNKPLAGVNASSTGAGITLSANTCGTSASPVSLGLNQTCSLTATFSPTAAGALSNGSVSVAANGAATQTRALTGTATLASASLTPDTGTDFGDVDYLASSVLSFTYANTGSEPMTGVKANVAGTGLVLQNNTCGTDASPGSLALDATCSVQVKFTPTSAATLANASLSLTATGVPAQTRSLTGRGVRAEGELTADTNADFGSIAVGATATRTFTFRNNGNKTATGVYSTVSSGQSLTAAGCGTEASPVTVAPGATCSVTVTYAPTASGSIAAGSTVRVVSSAFNSPSSVTLTGSAFSPFVSATGGSKSTVTVDGLTYAVHRFTIVGTHTFGVSYAPPGATVNLIVVGGGGGGGYDGGGGGGGGQVRTSASYAVSSGDTISVTVGAGGAGLALSGAVTGTAANGMDGSPTSFGTFTAAGGGGGGGKFSNGLPGASGGGAGHTYNSPNSYTGGAATAGFPGGNVTATNNTTQGGGAGGGGAGGAGQSVGATSVGGAGGAGLAVNVTGISGTFGCGGGGGNFLSSTASASGTGCGASSGRGGTKTSAAVAGAPNTGMGGGGGGATTPTNYGNGAAGGSGLVVVTYRIQ